MMSEHTEKRLSFSLFLIGAGCFCIFWFAGCKSQIGCTKRQERKASRKFYKGLSTCQAEIARQSLVAFPFQETDSVGGIRIVPGNTISMPPDTVTDTVNDTVYRTVYRDRFRTDTIFVDKIRKVEDQRGLLVRDAEINRLEAIEGKQEKVIAILETHLATSQKIGWYKTIAISGLISMLLAYIGIKYCVAKYKAIKAAKNLL